MSLSEQLRSSLHSLASEPQADVDDISSRIVLGRTSYMYYPSSAAVRQKPNGRGHMLRAVCGADHSASVLAVVGVI